MQYKIYPMDTGVSPTSKSKVMYHPDVQQYYDAEGAYSNPCIAYLVRGEGVNILVDTGMPEDAQCKRHMPDAGQPEGYSIIDRLKEHSVTPENIDAVIFTHLHWDHCGYIRRFINAAFYVQRTEYAMAMAPLPMYDMLYEGERRGFHPAIRSLPFHLVDGSMEICAGITMYPSFGHSIGHQSVSINTVEGVYHCCGDLCFSYDNLHCIPGTGYIVTPPARYESLSNIWNSLVALKTAAQQDHILPSHELSMIEACREHRVYG